VLWLDGSPRRNVSERTALPGPGSRPRAVPTEWPGRETVRCVRLAAGWLSAVAHSAWRAPWLPTGVTAHVKLMAGKAPG